MTLWLIVAAFGGFTVGVAVGFVPMLQWRSTARAWKTAAQKWQQVAETADPRITTSREG